MRRCRDFDGSQFCLGRHRSRLWDSAITMILGTMNQIIRATTLLLALALAGCVPDGVTDYDWKALQPPMPEVEEPGYVVVGESEVGDVTVRLAAWRGLHAGHNALRIRLAAGGTALAEAKVVVSAKVAGIAMPTVQPALSANADGFFPAEAFLLPRSSGEQTSLDVTITTADGASGTAHFSEALADSADGVRWVETVALGGETVAVSWVKPRRPETGDNVLELALHRLDGSGAARPVTDAALDLYPYMDMGGGDGHSTPYVAPVHVGEGRYRGSIQYVMSGGWDLTVFASRAGAPQTSVLFSGYTVFD